MNQAPKLDLVLVLIAAALNVTGSQIYIWTIVMNGPVKPSMTMWLVLSFISILNFLTYKEMSKDRLKSTLATISSVQTVLTFVLALFFGKAEALGTLDYAVIALGTATGFIWFKWRSAAVANVILQTAITIGFIPTFINSWQQPERELAWCWFLWMVSFMFQSAATGIRLKRWQEMAYPLNCVWLHGLVWIFALR